MQEPESIESTSKIMQPRGPTSGQALGLKLVLTLPTCRPWKRGEVSWDGDWSR